MEWNEINGENLNKINTIKKEIKDLLNENIVLCSRYYNKLDEFKEKTLNEFKTLASMHGFSVTTNHNENSKTICAISIAFKLLFNYDNDKNCFKLILKDNAAVQQDIRIYILFNYEPHELSDINYDLVWGIGKTGNLKSPTVSQEDKNNIKYYEKEKKHIENIIDRNRRLMERLDGMDFYYSFDLDTGINKNYKSFEAILDTAIKMI